MRLAGEQEVEVTLVERNGYHQFQPLLYQVATAELTARDVRFELADMFTRHHNVTVRGSAVASVDPEEKTVTLASGELLHGDVIVLAAGTKPNFFRVPGADEHALPLYSVADAERVRAHVLQLFADASAKPVLLDQGALTFAVVGGGPTGVETAGLSVQEVAGDHVRLSDNTTLATHLVIWGGGVSAAEVAGNSGVVQGRGGRIAVRPDLTVPGYDQVYAIGDVAAIPFGDETALPQLASVAELLGASTVDTRRINWNRRNR
jgi:NADH dehydrogenase